MIVKLRYGSSTVPLDLRGLTVRHLAPSAPPSAADPTALAGAALDRPLDGDGLPDLCRAARSATVVVPDATRFAALPRVLPAVLRRLADAGVPADRTRVLVACGTHPAEPDDALARLLGELPSGVVARQHDCRDGSDLVPVGELEPGVPIRLHRLAVETDVLVTVGAVRHHYFAGFGGGPKMVFPGIAGYEEIQHNHSRVLAGRHPDGGPRLQEGCEAGRLVGNPVAEEIARLADLLPPTIALCLAPGSDGGPAWAGAGRWRTAFAAAVERVRAWYEVPAGGFRLVVASGAGSPSDGTLIQAHKGLDAACAFAAPGAEVLYLASMDGGLGSADMERFVADPRPDAILAALERRWIQYGHTTLRIVDKTARFRVHLHSNLPVQTAVRLGFVPAGDPESVLEDWRERLPREAVAVVSGSPVYPARA